MFSALAPQPLKPPLPKHSKLRHPSLRFKYNSSVFFLFQSKKELLFTYNFKALSISLSK